MIGFTKLVGAQQVKDYFRRHYGPGDYFVLHREYDGALIPEVIEGNWYGRLTDLLGLSGQVGKKDFYSVVDRIHPETGEYLGSRKDRGRSDDKESVVGFDITFNAPKSLSNQFMLTKDYRILDVWNYAVRMIATEMEDDVAVRLKGKNLDDAIDHGVDVRKNSQGTWTKRVGNAVFAEFTHTTSRPEPDPETGIIFPDPHLHTHMVMGNFAYDADHINRDGSRGAWLAVDIEMMKARGEYYQARFHNLLTSGLTDMGYEVERWDEKWWDLKHHSQSMIDKTSRRDAAVKELAEKLGISGDKKLVGELARNMRHHKANTDISWTEVQEMWHKMFDELEWDVLTGLKHKADGVPLEYGMTAGEAVDYAAGHLLERSSTVAIDKFKAAAYSYAYGRVGIEDIDTEIERRIDEGDFFTGSDGGELKLSTRPVYLEEQYIYEFAGAGRGNHSRLGPREVTWETELFRNPRLDTAEQEAVAEAVLRSHDRVIGIRGPAGAGKTSLTEEVVIQLEAAGRSVVTLAPHGKGRKGLASEGFEDAMTVARFLVDVKAQAAVNEGDVIWIDEAAMVGAVNMADILRVAEGRGARVVLSGDTLQHRAVARGMPMQQLEARELIEVPELTEIRRQKPNPAYLRVAEQVSRGEVLAAFAGLNAMGSVVDVEGWDRQEYLDRLAVDYVEAIQTPNREGGQRSVLVVSPSNRERREASDAIRTKMKEFGLLSGEERVYSTRRAIQWTVAQRSDAASFRSLRRKGAEIEIRFHQNTGSDMKARGKGSPFFNKGGVFSVVDVVDDEVIVKDKEGMLAKLPLEGAENFVVYEVTETAVMTGESLKISRNAKLPQSEPGKRKKLSAVSNGEVARVLGFRENGDIIAEIDGEEGYRKEVVIPADFGYLEHGYVFTSVASQGATVDEVMIAQTGPSLGRATSAQQFYVSVTRGREKVTLYTSDQARLIRRIQDTSESISASELFEEEDARTVNDRRRREIGRHREAVVRMNKGKDAAQGLSAEMAASVRRHARKAADKEPARGDSWVERVQGE